MGSNISASSHRLSSSYFPYLLLKNLVRQENVSYEENSVLTQDPIYLPAPANLFFMPFPLLRNLVDKENISYGESVVLAQDLIYLPAPADLFFVPFPLL